MTSPDRSDLNSEPEKKPRPQSMQSEPQPASPESETKERKDSEAKLKSARKDRTRVTIAPSTDPGPDIQISSR